MSCSLCLNLSFCSDVFNLSQVKDHSDVSSEFSNISGLKNTKGQPVEVSTANTRTNNDFLASTSESDSPGPSTPRVPNFAEQLAAKLGNVIKENKSLLEEAEVNRRPIQKKQSDYGALISDEPPPLLDENVIGGENAHGIFSGGKGLFDDEDEDDDNLWNPGKPNISSRNQLGPNIARENNASKGLFEEDSDDDIFSSARKIDTSHQIKQSYLPSKTTAPIFSEEPPLLENEQQKEKKKPPGGVSPFGNASIFQSQKIGDILKQRKVNPSEDAVSKIIRNEPIPFNDPNEKIVENIDSIDQTISTVPREVQFIEPNIKERNIFNDSNQQTRINLPEENDIFENVDNKHVSQTINRKKGSDSSRDLENKTKNLFDDDIFGDDLFSDMDKKYTNLFTDEPSEKSSEIPRRNNEPTEDSLFQNVSEIENEYDYSWRKNSKSKIGSLFDDEDEDYDLFKPDKVAEKPKIQNKVDSQKQGILAEKKEDKFNESTKSKLSLFNDEFEDVDDLFTEILKNRKTVSAQKEADYDVSKKTTDNSEKSEHIQENRATKNVQFEEDIFEKKVNDPIIRIENTEIPKVETQPPSFISVPHVNFLDSVPPPEDGWDNSSDNAFDDFEPYGNDDFQSQPSSLFDSEPPSLFFNDTSAIVKDQDYQRINSVQPFDPSPMPSRESVDVFSDDRIFPTNNQNSKNTLSQSALPSVPEISDFHQEDSAGDKNAAVTGILKMPNDQVMSNDNTIDDQNEVAEPKKTGNVGKSVAFLDDIFDEDETDDLFATRTTDVSISKISGSIIADKDKDDGFLLDKNLDRDEKKTSEESAILDKGDEMQSNISKITEKFQQMARSTEDSPKNIAIPGKLTHKLQINVGALLPGGAPPRRNKEQDNDDSQEENFLSKSLPASKFRPDVGEQRVSYLRKTAPIFRTVSESDASKNIPKLEKSVSFDDTTDIEVLRSVTKGRPKIQVKRRPSSRRARQESLRKSVPDFRLLDDATDSDGTEQITKENPKEISRKIEDTPKPSVIEILPQKAPEFVPNPILKANIFEDEDDEADDLFKSIQKDVKSVNQAKIVSTRKQDLFADDGDFFETIKKRDEKNSRHALDEPKVMPERKPLSIQKVAKKEKNFLFDSSDDSDDFLKSTIKEEKTNQPTISIIGKLPQNKSKDLFDSSDEDGDFLDSLVSAKGLKEEKPKPSKTRGSALFSDENDDEDIFGSSGPKNKTKPDIQPSVIDKKAPKPSSLRKLGSIDGEEDPLSALLR